MPTATINGHKMYYEIHGEGEPAICMGGWGTFCHGGTGNLARGLTDRYQVLLIDYRGIGESEDDLSMAPSMALHAADVIALMDHLGWRRAHFIGLVGMGACVSQIVALERPDLVRSMVNMGCWARCDAYLRDQLEMLRDVHRDMGFEAFQKLVCVLSFRPDYYNVNKDKLVGPEGAWSELRDNYDTHHRLVEACITHDIEDRLAEIEAPTLVLHAGMDIVTSPRYTQAIERGLPNAEGVMMAEVAHVVAGKEQKIRFCELLFDFLERH